MSEIKKIPESDSRQILSSKGVKAAGVNAHDSKLASTSIMTLGQEVIEKAKANPNDEMIISPEKINEIAEEIMRQKASTGIKGTASLNKETGAMEVAYEDNSALLYSNSENNSTVFYMENPETGSDFEISTSRNESTELDSAYVSTPEKSSSFCLENSRTEKNEASFSKLVEVENNEDDSRTVSSQSSKVSNFLNKSL